MAKRSLVSVVDDDESGRDLQVELRRRGQEIAIVFITAQGDEMIRPSLLAHGAVECLFKPFSDTALLDALNAALRTR
jgi:FixJ family two-component response regulator